MQEEAIERLKNRYSGMKATVIRDATGSGLLGLPKGWVLVNISRDDGTIKLQAGVSPEGRVHT